jgi:flagellar basal-body rod modification protein FlgD
MSNNVNGLPSSIADLAIKQATSTPNNSQLSQDTFLKLMVAQMNNQDPTHPMDNSQFLSQLAQFGTVNGITQLQTSFQTLASTLQSNQALQASTMVGRNVMVSGNAYATDSAGGKVSGAVNLTQDTGQLTVQVYNSAGTLVREIPMGAKSAGQVPFTWDGTDSSGNAAPAGVYRVVAGALVNGQTAAMDTLMQGKVDSVTLPSGGGTPSLNVSGLGTVSMDTVKQLS